MEKLGGVYGGTSLALDSAGNPRIGYHDKANGTLKYASSANASWHTSVVAPDGQYGQEPSLVLDPATGYPRFSYFDYANNVLKYASYNGTAWQFQSLGWAGHDSSLVLDSAGRPHISFAESSQLRYASWTGSAWNIQTVDPTAGSSTSLALDGQGNPRISYGDFHKGNLKYAEFDGQAWHISTLDTGYVALSTSLALDSHGHPCIAYGGPSNTALKYAEYNGTAWNLQTLDVAGNTGYDVSMVLDKSNNVHISYRYMQSFNPNNGDLKYARGNRIGGASATPSPTPTPPGGPPSAEAGSLYVATYPPNAMILVNGTERGYTNRLVSSIPAGNVNLTLVKDGYQPYSTIVRIPAGDVKTLAPITLTKGEGHGGSRRKRNPLCRLLSIRSNHSREWH